MQTVRYRPAAPLDACIDCFWYRCGREEDPRRSRALPTGSVDVSFNLHEDSLRAFEDDADTVGVSARGAIVHGAQSRYFVLDARRDVRIVGVHFRPGAGAALLGAGADELRDRHPALEALWGRRALTLREQLLEAPSVAAMFSVLETEFIARLRSCPQVHPVVAYAMRSLRSSPAAARIGAVQEATGYGPRRFVALFADAVGLTPKQFARVQRMRNLVEHAAASGSPLWSALAQEFGYFDQSHLIREFRDLCGVTPGEYRPQAAQRPLHIAMAACAPVHDAGAHVSRRK